MNFMLPMSLTTQFRIINMKLIILFSIVFTANTGILAENDYRDVETGLGLVRGYLKLADNGNPFFSFEGVPYAEPPTGRYRFKEPRQKKPWKNVLFANTTISCLQYTQINYPYVVIGQEDCLYLNIYTPKSIPKGKLYDVIIHVHGGAFMWGNGYQWKPNNILKYDVVYVNLNYRLGPLGFLSTEDNVVPGNNGMKDQVLALRWIKTNIEYFGGNPNSITLTGLSAGGASVLLHILSPLSRGLFNRVFALSGTPLNPWAHAEGSLEKAKKLAASVNCDYDSNQEMIDCLRQQSGEEIVEKVSLFQVFLYNPFSPWAPIVECNNPNAFLDKPAYDILVNGEIEDVPLIMSTVEGEGLYPGAEFIRDPSYLEIINNNWTGLAPFILDFNYTLKLSEQAYYAERIRKFYLGDEAISMETFPKLIKMMSDRLFIKTIEETARILVKRKKTPLYFQYFTYLGSTSLAPQFSKKPNTLAPSHADDLNYVLVNAPVKPDPDNIEIQNILTEIWLSFAKNGHPSVPNTKFKPMTIDKSNKFTYLKIASPREISMEETETLTKSYTFWDKIPFEENKRVTQK